MTMPIDLTGRTFGRLVVAGTTARSPSGKIRWRCICTCGGSTDAMTDALKSGKTQSCGCLRKERLAAALIKHGEGSRLNGESREYRAWVGMLTRCYNDHNRKYRIYGGRGITVCDRWKTSYVDFLNDLGRCPPRFSLDRIDVNGDYAPNNCRWATASIQAFNKRPKRRAVNLPTGIVPKKYGRYQAVIGASGKLINLGSFGNVDAAIATRHRAEIEFYGQHSPQ